MIWSKVFVVELEIGGHIWNICLDLKPIEFADGLNMERGQMGEIKDDFHISSLSSCVDYHSIYWDRETRKQTEVGKVINKELFSRYIRFHMLDIQPTGNVSCLEAQREKEGNLGTSYKFRSVSRLWPQ